MANIKFRLSNEKKPWLFRLYRGLYYLVPSYIGILISHYKDSYIFWVVVSKIFFNFHPYLGKIAKLTNIFQMGWSWNHQLVLVEAQNST